MQRAWIPITLVVIVLLVLVGRELRQLPAGKPRPTAQPIAQRDIAPEVSDGRTGSVHASNNQDRSASLTFLRLRLEAARTMVAARAPALEDLGARVVMATEQIEDELTESMHRMKRCWPYEDGSGEKLIATFVLLSDPELGMFVDTPPSTAEDGTPFDPAIDDCIRDVIDGLELPGTRSFAKTTEHWHFDF